MTRTQLNVWIDTLAFVAFLVLLSTGLVLSYQLPPGSGSLEAPGTGHGAGERKVTLLWGWTRHEWGEFHFWVAALMVAVLAVHLVLHWKWIACVVRGKPSDASGIRFGLGLASGLALLVLAAVPTLVNTRQLTRHEVQELRGFKTQRPSHADVELRGSMTVEEVADALGSTVDDLVDALGLKNKIQSDEQVGRALRRNGLKMSDLRRAAGVATASSPPDPAVR